MHVALGKRDDGSKAHCRADGDDERSVRHRLVELLEGDHRFERKNRHQEAGSKKNKARLVALDQRPDGTDSNNECYAHGPGGHREISFGEEKFEEFLRADAILRGNPRKVTYRFR